MSNENNPNPAGRESGSESDMATEAVGTPSEWAELRAKAAKAEEHWNTLLRTTADFDNFKKRAARERQEAFKFAAEGVIEKLIPVLDNFEMAFLASQQTPSGGASASDSLRTGVSMILQQFKGVLAEEGLTELNAQGQPFDPNLHEAVSQQETSDIPDGHVVQQLRKGYRLKERLLRPATVVVAKAPAK